MAINIKNLVYKIRFKVKDLNEILYSDFDIIEAVNECIRYLNQEKALKNSDFLEKLVRYRQDLMNAEIEEKNKDLPEDQKVPLYNFPKTGVELPDDMISLVDIMRAKDGYHMSPIPAVEQINPYQSGQYKVINGRIYTNTDFDLLYRAEIAQVDLEEMSDPAAVVELPVVFTDLLVKVSVMILTNTADNDVMAQEISRVADNLIPGRRYNNIKVRMPFKV